jgi:hypothetical protein
MADYIRPTPRNPLLGLLSDALTGGVEWMRSPQRAQQMQGLGGLLAETGIPATVERMSYGEPLTKGRGMTTRLRPEAEAALMTLAPEAVPIGRAAMAGIRATKGLPVGASIVYHGSPYRFQRFDPTKIGSGEGAQAYGYGHYVAESPGVAKQYQETLSQKTFSRLEQKGRNDYRVTAPDGSVLIDGVPLGRATQVKNEFDKGQTGSLYTIDLPDPAIARMLDWDKPLSEQPESVRKAVLPLLNDAFQVRQYKGGWGNLEPDANAVRDVFTKSGQPLGTYLAADADALNFSGSAIVKALGNMDKQSVEVSKKLRQAGIPGIRYLDQGSRGAGQGTSNFVVFPGEEDLLRILSVEGGLLAP